MTNDGRFNGYVQSVDFNGDALITLEEDAVVMEKAGKSLVVPYAEIDGFSVQDYRLAINAETYSVLVSQLGRDVGVLYERLWDAYNARTLRAFFVRGAPQFEAQGEYRYADDGGRSQGTAKIKLFDNCLCILPPSSDARRIPLCFMKEPIMTEYTITMTLDTGENYEVIRLGDRTKRLFELIQEKMMKIHKNAVTTVKSIDGSLNSRQASDIAWLVPDGAAAQSAALESIAPSFVKASEARIALSRAADTYAYFKEICAPGSLYAGIKTGLSETEEEADIIWVTAIKEKDGAGTAAVELALPEEDSAATYIYKFKGDQASFFKRLNHSMEAISFRREVISMPYAELKLEQNALYAMAVKRTGALRFLRSCFAGRAIHRTLESWKSSINEWMEL
ncbi:MAG: hypothetical protein GX936_01935 [Clostridiales bacterium]|jgi:hypothetical protein|nr:hypothetical protein [Clostridiales bacterium]